MSIDNDVKNCGACGNVCSFDHAWTACQDGVCVMGQCQNNWGDCNNDSVDGCETDLMVHRGNCGSCGNLCATGESCVDGVCRK
jgi:hypothetical protein